MYSHFVDKEAPAKKRTRKKSFYLIDVIERCVINHKGKPPAFWTKEMTFLKKLMKQYPNEDFWKKVSLKEVTSLVAFLTSEAPYIKLKYSEFNFQPELKTEEIKLGDKIGDDYNSAAKPKTIKNFLK